MEERKKKMHAAVGKNMRDIVVFINDEGLQKEDLFTLISEGGGYTLLYFK
jgi:hypothetical protein